ncbi:cytochrome c nitrite reductase small subunit [Malaciobacter mytili]|uniref:Cytochrome c nitrite reductase small subunit n=1 Tax=Malaciobacter mytili LMG 24559 TaxID=1032238 RepID=A0AAX2AKP6_9BACT|nr:cytochrome c nitrite reductase small subunit [Malaciobacter mytili]AXH14047.1 formate-dependent nitrite reductase NrfAH, membrane-bound tetraheme cytochrome c subunit [Malaciobacter mytili LMG 24559]RXI43456.1 cytochrome c nitrite reductase small subunit [Malaciobacter mytili]RXK16926.1 cytochrome c nitrite reductase small subunit [Malaciobacter mytili LMG 24559]
MEKNKKIVVYGTVLSLLVAASLFVYTVYASNMLSYLSSDPKACINCHTMNSAFATWENSSHKNVAGCVDCHLPVDNFVAKYKSKAIDGWNHSVAFTLNTYENNIHISDDGANRVQANCVRCHASENATLKMNADKYHSGEDGSLENGRKCWECHKYVPHGKVRSLVSTPYNIGVKEKMK